MKTVILLRAGFIALLLVSFVAHAVDKEQVTAGGASADSGSAAASGAAPASDTTAAGAKDKKGPEDSKNNKSKEVTTFKVLAPLAPAYTYLGGVVRVQFDGDQPISCEDISLTLGDYTELADSCKMLPLRTASFSLKKNVKNSDSWRALLGQPFAGEQSPHFAVYVSLKKNLLTQQDDPPREVAIKRYNAGWLTFPFVLAALVAILLVAGAIKTCLLRDSGIPQMRPTERTYSLGRVQMAWWFFWTITAFTFVWAITGTLAALDPQSLALIGISGGTALGAVAIDQTKAGVSSIGDQVQQLGLYTPADVDELKNLVKDSTKANAPLPSQFNVPNTTAPRKTVQQTLDEYKRLTAPLTTRNIWMDVVTDNSGAALHRFQMIVWTLVLGCVWAWKTYSTLETPQFEPTLLGLMGISGLLYLGFKMPEQQTP